MDRVIFKTPHGSHLYGLAHESSDEDFYTVVFRAKRGRRYKYAKQSIVDNVDSLTVDLGTWLRLCDKGVPQALEAMFSPVPLVDEISALRNSYRVNFDNMRDTYHRTMQNFVAAGDEKRRRHALRLYLNLKVAARRGRFNPVLSDKQKWWMEQVLKLFNDDELAGMLLSNGY